MATKANPGAYDCYANAADDEPLFTLLGHDRHAAALTELWAWMREKEGEPAAVVAEAREVAAAMATYGRALGKPVLTLDSLIALAASLVHDRESERAAKAEAAAREPLPEEGDFVTSKGSSFNGHVGVITKVFPPDAEPQSLRGQVNVRYGKPPQERTVTVGHASLRAATPAEIASSGATR
jgi:hypothetical protein